MAKNELYESILTSDRFFDGDKLKKLSLDDQKTVIRYAVDNRDEPNSCSENLMDALLPYFESVLAEALGPIDDAGDGESIYFEDLFGGLLMDYFSRNPGRKWHLENIIAVYTGNGSTENYEGLTVPPKKESK